MLVGFVVPIPTFLVDDRNLMMTIPEPPLAPSLLLIPDIPPPPPPPPPVLDVPDPGYNPEASTAPFPPPNTPVPKVPPVQEPPPPPPP